MDHEPFRVLIDTGNPQRRAVLGSVLQEELALLGVEPAKEETAHERFTPLDVLYAFAGSGSAYVIANAIRDFARKQRIKIKVTRSSGDAIEIDGSGSELGDLSDIVGFLESSHRKVTEETRKVNVNESRNEKVTSRKARPQEPT